MNGPEISRLIENDLRRAVLGHAAPPPDPMPTTPWIVMSLLQKAIRRGRQELASRAAATLLMNTPDRLWRRLGCIAAEDVGLGDIRALGLATAAMTRKKLRTELGGDWQVASTVITELARAPKCRAADDLLMSCDLHPAYAPVRTAQSGLSLRELVEIVIGEGEVHEKALALRRVLERVPRTPRPAKGLGDLDSVFDRLCEAGWAHSLVETARQNFKRTGEPLAPFVALLSRELKDPIKVEADGFPPEIMIGDIPSWSVDVYSREGRFAIGRFLRTDAPAAEWVKRHVRPVRQVGFLGHLLFRVEGGLVDYRMRWPLSDRLRREADVECAGQERPEAIEVLELVRADIPRLNEVRAEVFGSRHHD